MPPHPPSPRPLPPNPPKTLASEPIVHFSVSYLYALRSRPQTGQKTYLTLLRQSLKKVALEGDGWSVARGVAGPGGPNSFFSRARYWHPDPAQLAAYLRKDPSAKGRIGEWEDKVAWGRRDGVAFDVGGYGGGGRTMGDELGALAEEVWLLSLGWHFSQGAGSKFGSVELGEKYAKRACELLWTFFGDQRTGMLPEVLYGQYIPATQPKEHVHRPEGLLHIRRLILISQVLPLLPPPPHPYSPHYFMHPWLTHHVDFLLYSELGKNAAKRRNNISTHYYAMLCTHLHTLNRAPQAHSLLIQLFTPSPSHPLGIAYKINPTTGSLPHELARPTSFHYTSFELSALVFLAELGAPSLFLWREGNYALVRAVHFGIEHFFSAAREEGADLRDMVFVVEALARAGVKGLGRGRYAWLIGEGGGRGMEEEGKGVLLQGWTVGGRLKWALREGY